MELGFDLDSLINKGKKKFKYTFANLKEGSAIYRILPSFTPENREVDHTYNFHWITAPTGEPEKVSCTYYTEKVCPICIAHKDTVEALKHAKDSGNEELAKKLTDAEWRLHRSKSIYYNAVNSANEVVILQLTSTVSQLLTKKIIESVVDKKFDPTNPKTGVWFKFTKVGKGRDSVTVDFNRISKTDEAGDIVEKLDRTPVSDELLATLQEKAANIHDAKTMWISTYTARQLGDLLNGRPVSESAPAPAVRVVPQAVAPQAPAPQAAVQASESPQATSNGSADFAKEIARLRSLQKGEGK